MSVNPSIPDDDDWIVLDDPDDGNDLTHGSVNAAKSVIQVDQGASAASEPPGSFEPWVVYMVDDDKEVHSATLLALRGVKIAQRPVVFLHAHSAREARAVLALPETKVHIIILDMMMETALAGVELAEWIKKNEHTLHIPVLLRSGQSGLAGEIEHVRALGVEGIASKGSLTRDFLINTMHTLLNGGRVYAEE